MFELISIKCARCKREMVVHKRDTEFEAYCGLCSAARSCEQRGVKQNG